MKNTVILPLRYRWNLKKTTFRKGENDFIEYQEKEFIFPISHILSGIISDDSETDVILIRTTSEYRKTEQFADEAKEELNSVLSGRCKHINYKVIDAPYSSTKNELGMIYRKLCNEISPETNIYADLTFGPKYMPLVVFCALNYAEKYSDCNIKRVLYGLFDGQKDNKGTIVDFTSLYLLNTFGAMFDGSKESFDAFTKSLI